MMMMMMMMIYQSISKQVAGCYGDGSDSPHCRRRTDRSVAVRRPGHHCRDVQRNGKKNMPKMEMGIIVIIIIIIDIFKVA